MYAPAPGASAAAIPPTTSSATRSAAPRTACPPSTDLASMRPQHTERCSADISGPMGETEATAKRGELLWEPSAESIERSQMTRYMRWLAEERGLEFDDYEALWRWSATEIEDFWASIWDFFGVEASAPYSEALHDHTMPGADWFEG